MSDQILVRLESPELVYLRKKDKRLAKLISIIGPLEYHNRKASDGYCFLIHEIIEQMLSIKAAKKIYVRFEEMCGGTITPEIVARLSEEEMRTTGTSSAKANYIKSVTSAVLDGKLILSELENLSDAEAIKKLTSIRGIGNWTAKMYLLFVLNRTDILPFEDVAFLQGYKWLYKTSDTSKESVQRKCKKWKPYSSYAARYLYRAVDLGLTKMEFHLFKDM